MSKNKVAIVTGGSGSIGSAICRRLGRDGYHIIVHYNSNKEAAETIVEEIRTTNGTATLAQADVAKEAEVEQLFKQASEAGEISLVVINAGVVIRGEIADFELSDFDKVIDANLRGAFLTLRAAARQVCENGSIVCISSGLAKRSRGTRGIYAATKAAVDAMVVAASDELGAKGIRVNSLRPGAIIPGMAASCDEQQKREWAESSPFGRIGTPEDIASVVSFFGCEDSKWITGQCLGTDGGSFN